VKKRIAKEKVFKAIPTIVEEDEPIDKGEGEDFVMIIRKVGKMFYKKERMNNFRRTRPPMRSERRKEEMCPYYHCKKTGYLIADCPSLQATIFKKLHKKAMVAI